MELLYPGPQRKGSAILRNLVDPPIPSRAKRAVFGPSVMYIKRMVAIVVFTAAVGLGYAYGLMKRNVLREEVEDSDVEGKKDCKSGSIPCLEGSLCLVHYKRL
jgi:hypothetical protein